MEESGLPNYRNLLDRVVKNDERAFSELYDLFARDLSKHIYAKVADFTVAEDILHDLFLSLWRNRNNLASITSLPAYLYSSCRYLIMAHFRKQLAKTDSIDFQELDILDETIAIEDRLHYRYLIDIVTNEIENLPEKCREVFKLSRSEYLSNKEIAEKMQISESTVEKHINKAIKRLRDVTGLFLLF
ncbi:RNA polymerase sigma factor [Sphingobacterium psychroaquaticum]|uniref:RNA polymerase sigma-70 factor, ECF subfamily n=1 Tax=Sphingobacterium psychroaquaticum TaxID=561061 RepID=A0A1X7K4H4_9SPHI|nr:sigma-70 family RNA polymerase sigma factor [Sphingobacterium psychroaquaticum]QBQ42619.1 sigma-70 family RNA polymerase sigma factor [Sphingobacterium psychroaquaticum]SMG35909.1 RNA polymerase sigma-70 factor, ECF subfamily [Sphingobacterium psychroaquaticum]